jgi:hypothetical protein
MPPEETKPTLADYVTLAISPVLIMTLVGSLVFFLLAVLYGGEYAARLRWMLYFFVPGIVLIARISMTEHIRGRAGLYGAALGFVTFLSMQTFVEYPKDSAVAELSWLINLGLIGIVWWCAHRLTWDCTHIAEESDAGGEGLLEAAGLQQGEKAETKPEAEKDKDAGSGLAGWWRRYQRYRQGRSKKRSLGVWVVYFSLAALPIFGLGQLLIPVEDAERRRYVFWLMSIYVASGLGLLLCTCFLGVRRYLRQRKLRMPAAMTGVWLSLGGFLIAVLLVAGAFLPRPEAEYPLFEFSPVGSEQRDASDYAMKGDTPGKGKGRPGDVGDPKAEEGNAPGKKGDAGGNSGQGKDGSGEGKDGSGQGQNNSGQGQNSSGQGQSSSGGNQSGQGQGQKGQQGSGKDEQGKAQQGAGEKKDGAGKGDQAGRPGGGGRRDQAGRPGGRGGSSRSGSPAPSAVSATFRSIASFLKWLVFILLALVVLFFVLRGLLQFLANFTGWARGLLEALRNFWAGLFGNRKRASRDAPEETPGPLPIPERPFSSYPNPFQDGSAASMTAKELVRYTFAAVQAWARERDLGRQPGETALEFVERVCGEVPPLEDALRVLVMLYGRAVYAPGNLPASAPETVRQFWDRLLVVVEQPLSA